MLDMDVAVVGMGPAGLFAAAELARRGRSVALVGKFPVAQPDFPRLELVPWAAIQRLQSLFGPLEGVEPVDEPRRVAWAHADPEIVSMPGALVDRSVFDGSFLRAVLQLPGVLATLCNVRRQSCRTNVFGRVRAGAWLDASGRASVSARVRCALARPFFARSFVAPRPRQLARGLSIAATDTGYVVRLCSDRRVVLTLFATRSEDRALARLPEILSRANARFVLAGLPRLGAFRAGVTHHASVQAFYGAGARIGDAAFARDALSSQGISSALSDARYGASVAAAADLEQLAQRQQVCLMHHLEQLEELAGACRFASSPVWNDYRVHIGEFRDRVRGDTLRVSAPRNEGAARGLAQRS
jgi:2-polyprenyl-6-methoxyphenol hydroxylase-like FAD-dependent oxidoreductase